MNEEFMFVIKKARMGFGKFHSQHTQNKAIINTKTKYSNHIILGIARSSCFIHICFGIVGL